MASYKSAWSSIRYHTFTQPAIKLAGKAVGSLIDRYKHKGSQRSLDIKRKVHKKTRIDKSGATDLHEQPHLFAKNSISGAKRRKWAADKLREQRAAGLHPKRNNAFTKARAAKGSVLITKLGGSKRIRPFRLPT